MFAHCSQINQNVCYLLMQINTKKKKTNYQLTLNKRHETSLKFPSSPISSLEWTAVEFKLTKFSEM